MHIERAYFGTWFQRTNLHLEEVFDFLKTGAGGEGLDQTKLDELRKPFGAIDVAFNETRVNSIMGACGQVHLSYTEDGVMLLGAGEGETRAAFDTLTAFHAGAVAPAFKYLFGRGAPHAKEVAGIEKEGAFIAIVRNAKPEAVAATFASFEDGSHSNAESEGIKVFAGRKLELIDLGTTEFSVAELEGFVRDLVFFREYERQLHAYLRLHRVIWGKLLLIREAKSLRYRDFPEVREKIMGLQKTLGIVSARLAQMDDIIGARRHAEGKGMARLLSALGMYNFDSLRASRSYVAHLWKMTDDYAAGTLGLLETLYQENAQREFNALKLITLLGATTSFFGMNIAFPWNAEWHDDIASSLAVAGIVALTAVAVQWLLRITIQERYFVIKEEKKENG